MSPTLSCVSVRRDAYGWRDEREGKLPSIDPSGHLAACCCYVLGVPYESPHITALRSYEILSVKPLLPRFHCP